jgi:small subunit ribosomal protein S2
LSVNFTIKELLDAGAHFGHRSSRWNPKMAPYISSKRNRIHVLDVRETAKGLLRAAGFVRHVASDGGTILLVGTKQAAREAVRQEAARCGVPFVDERWLGGTLTNFRTVLSRMGRLKELDVSLGDGSVSQYGKKMIATWQRERRKLKRNLGGLHGLDRLPDVLVVVDPRREHIAVREARKLGIPTVALIDTDCDPKEVDVCVPANDDSVKMVQIFLRVVGDAIVQGKAELEKAAERPEEVPASAEALSVR